MPKASTYKNLRNLVTMCKSKKSTRKFMQANTNYMELLNTKPSNYGICPTSTQIRRKYKINPT